LYQERKVHYIAHKQPGVLLPLDHPLYRAHLYRLPDFTFITVDFFRLAARLLFVLIMSICYKGAKENRRISNIEPQNIEGRNDCLFLYDIIV